MTGLIFFVGGLAEVKVGDKYGYIDNTGAIIIKPKYQGTTPFFDDIASVRLDWKWGAINKKGEWVITNKYDRLTYFYNGRAAFSNRSNRINGKKNEGGILDLAGNLVGDIYNQGPRSFGARAEWDYIKGIRGFSDSIYHCVTRDGGYGLINGKGELVLPIQNQFTLGSIIRYSYTQPPFLAAKRLNGRDVFGYVDLKGREVIPFRFSDAFPFSEDIAAVELDGRVLFINKSGDVVIDNLPNVQMDKYYFINGICFLQNMQGKWGVINREGEMIIDFFDFDEINFSYSSEGLLPFKVKDSLGYLDYNGEVIIEPLPFDEVNGFRNGLALVTQNGEELYINKSGKVVFSSKDYSLREGNSKVKEWELYKHTQNSVQISFPDTFNISVNQKQNYRSTTIQSNSNVLYTFSVSDFDEMIPDKEKLTSAIIGDLIKAMEAQIVNSEDFFYKNYRGKEAQVINGENQKARLRVIIIGQQIFYLIVSGDSRKWDDEKVNLFLNSFDCHSC